MQNVAWPTLVDIAAKFRLGAEIQSPTGLSVCLCNYCPFDVVLQIFFVDIKSASNIVFSNGLLDPWCRGGVSISLHI